MVALISISTHPCLNGNGNRWVFYWQEVVDSVTGNPINHHQKPTHQLLVLRNVIYSWQDFCWFLIGYILLHERLYPVAATYLYQEINTNPLYNQLLSPAYTLRLRWLITGCNNYHIECIIQCGNPRYYSVPYFECIIEFEVLWCRTSAKGWTHMCHEYPMHLWSTHEPHP